MRRSRVFFLPLLCLAVWIHPAAAITQGQKDEGHPNVGAIVADVPGFGLNAVCTGTLIHPRVLLTAGHCTSFLEGLIAAGDLALDNIKISFDSTNALNFNTGLAIQELVAHPAFPGFRGASDWFDVGVIILAEPVEGIEPATLPELFILDQLRAQHVLRNGSEGARFTVVGYGSTLLFDPQPVVVPGDGIRRVAQAEFQTLNHFFLFLSQNRALGNGGAGFGDSGGPNFWVDPDTGDELLVGITSWGDSKTVSTNICYRVDIPQTLEFIDDMIKSLDQ